MFSPPLGKRLRSNDTVIAANPSVDSTKIPKPSTPRCRVYTRKKKTPFSSADIDEETEIHQEKKKSEGKTIKDSSTPSEAAEPKPNYIIDEGLKLKCTTSECTFNPPTNLRGDLLFHLELSHKIMVDEPSIGCFCGEAVPECSDIAAHIQGHQASPNEETEDNSNALDGFVEDLEVDEITKTK